MGILRISLPSRCPFIVLFPYSLSGIRTEQKNAFVPPVPPTKSICPSLPSFLCRHGCCGVEEEEASTSCIRGKRDPLKWDFTSSGRARSWDCGWEPSKNARDGREKKMLEFPKRRGKPLLFPLPSGWKRNSKKGEQREREAFCVFPPEEGVENVFTPPNFLPVDFLFSGILAQFDDVA